MKQKLLICIAILYQNISIKTSHQHSNFNIHGRIEELRKITNQHENNAIQKVELKLPTPRETPTSPPLPKGSNKPYHASTVSHIAEKSCLSKFWNCCCCDDGIRPEPTPAEIAAYLEKQKK